MVKMLTLFGVEDLRQLKYNDLKRELRAQKFIRLCITSMLKIQQHQWRDPPTPLAQDKMAIADIYVQHLDALIAEIEYVMAHRSEPLTNATTKRSRRQIRRENEAKRQAAEKEKKRVSAWKKSIERDSIPLSWDRDKFMLIAQDRGYQTEDAVVQDVSKELNLDLARAKIVVDKGRFTWGQVLCVGAMMQMTPKEFCDTFLAGYFTNQYGEYRASIDGVAKQEILKYVYRPIEEAKPVVREISLDLVEVGADGKPLDEEEWF